MNILFFDFDGVLASWEDWSSYDKNNSKLIDRISNNKIRFINKLLKDNEINAAFFPISSWSYVFKDKDILDSWLKDMNLTNFYSFNGIGSHYYSGNNRGEFIKKILSDNKIKNYVILDDEEHENEYNGLNFIKTDMYNGILYENILALNEYINNWK